MHRLRSCCNVHCARVCVCISSSRAVSFLPACPLEIAASDSVQNWKWRLGLISDVSHRRPFFLLVFFLIFLKIIFRQRVRVVQVLRKETFTTLDSAACRLSGLCFGTCTIARAWFSDSIISQCARSHLGAVQRFCVTLKSQRCLCALMLGGCSAFTVLKDAGEGQGRLGNHLV